MEKKEDWKPSSPIQGLWAFLSSVAPNNNNLQSSPTAISPAHAIIELENIPCAVPQEPDPPQKISRAPPIIKDPEEETYPSRRSSSEVSTASNSISAQSRSPSNSGGVHTEQLEPNQLVRRKSKVWQEIAKSKSVTNFNVGDDEKVEARQKKRCSTAHSSSSFSEKVRRLFSPRSNRSNRVMDLADLGIEEQSPNDSSNNQSNNEEPGKESGKPDGTTTPGEFTQQDSNAVTITMPFDDDSQDSPTNTTASFRVAVHAQTVCTTLVEQARQNIFLNSMQCLYGVLQAGYYCCLVPFQVEIIDGVCGIRTEVFNLVLLTALLIASLWFQCCMAYDDFIGVTNIKGNPEQAFLAAQMCTEALVTMAYAYGIVLRNSKFGELFATFNTTNPQHYEMTKRFARPAFLGLVIILFGCAFWFSVGQFLYEGATWEDLLNGFRSTLGLPVLENAVLNTLLEIMIVFIGFYVQLMKCYIDVVMWASAITLYLMERRTRKYCMQEEFFDLKKGSQVFRQIKQLVRKINMALGPLIVVYHIHTVLFGIHTVTSTMNQGGGIDWIGRILIAVCMMKIGSIFLAAEGSANTDNLVEDVLANKIRYKMTPVTTVGSLGSQVYHMNLVTEFRDVSKRAICLCGMDFFDVNHPLLGTVGLALVTYILLIVEWKFDCIRSETCETPGKGADLIN